MLMSKLSGFCDSFQPVQRSSLQFALLMPTHDGFKYYSPDANDSSHCSTGPLPMTAHVAILFLTSSGGIRDKGRNDPQNRIYFSIHELILLKDI